jgi:hypothetical protein
VNAQELTEIKLRNGFGIHAGAPTQAAKAATTRRAIMITQIRKLLVRESV